MNYSVKEFSDLSGVSIRTLHYYDEIGLLKPSYINKMTHYRYYDENTLLIMQEILFYRELNFPLNEIKELIVNGERNKNEALKKQKELLILKKQRLEKIIAAIENIEKGKKIDMKAFDNSEFESAKNAYKKEAYEKWGNTEAYKEYEERNNKIDFKSAETEMSEIFKEFALLKEKGYAPESNESINLVNKLQKFITDNFYTCTDEILKGLSFMYVNDERFKNNINKEGMGTAEFVSDAIQHKTK